MANDDIQLPGDYGLPATSQLYVGGVKIEDAVAGQPVTTYSSSQEPPKTASAPPTTPNKPQIAASQRFWASTPKPLNWAYSDGIIINLAKPKRINYLALDLPAFPHHFYFMYWDAKAKDWREFKGPSTGSIRVYIDGSTPAVVGTAAAYQSKQHPSHYGAGHWLHYDIDVVPVTTSRIRLTGNRNFGSRKGGPVTPQGKPAKYSLGVRNLDFGWRVRTKKDVPRTPRDPDILTENQSFTQTLDLLGSPVELKMRENRASDLLKGSAWKCEPQPVPYAVVNFYVDARDKAGNSQVIDRFNLTPLQAGSNLNLYYSDQVPDADFGASDAPIIFPMLRSAGETEPKPGPSGILFANKIGYIDLTNQAVQWDPSKPFWFALEFQPQWASTDTTPHVIFDAGSLQLAWNDGVFRLMHNGGALYQQPLEFGVNARLRAFVSYDGEQLSFYMPETGAVANVPSAGLGMTSEAIRLGAELGDSTAPVVFTGHYRLNAMLIKQEAVTFRAADGGSLIVPEGVRRFIEDPATYLDKPEYQIDEDGSTDNALVRYLPSFVQGSVNPHGFVGGPGTIYEDVVWTPVMRDYKLRAGMLQFHPVRAKFFKFEFTNLTPEPYQTYAPITREVKTYSQAAQKNAVNPQKTSTTNQSATSTGLSANADATMQTVRYADTPAITNPSDEDVLPTEALYATDLGTQNQLDAAGGLYRFDSWQPGTSAPRYVETSRHYYETVKVGHSKKIAYFVGLSKLEMFRVDYSADDDTEQYIELFDDTLNIDPEYLTERIVIGTTNWVTNPSFENGTTGHTLYTAGTATGAALSTTADGVYGPNALRVIATTLGNTGSDRVGWQSTYTTPDFEASVAYSIYAKKVAGTATLRLHIEYYDGSAAFISSDSVTFSPTTTWERYSAILLPPLTTASAKVHWWLESGGGAAVEYRFDGYQIENLRLTDYVDGSLEGGQWTGTANASASVREDVSIRPWAWDGDRLVTFSEIGSPVTTVSRRFSSKRRVRGVQFATQQSQSVQLLADPDFFNADLAANWVPVGDVITMEHSEEFNSTLGNSLKILRSSSINTWFELRATYPSWGDIEASEEGDDRPLYGTLEGSGEATGYGGVALRTPVQASEAGRITAAARVFSDHALGGPLTLQIVSSFGDVMAQKDVTVTAGRIVEWDVSYTVGETPPTAQTWADIMRRDPSSTLPTYGDLETGTWANLTDVEVAQSRHFTVRVIQQGPGQDTWHVDNISLFEDPITWEFSNDDGKNWWPALGIRNDPRGVLIFPNSEEPVPDDPTGLRWRVTGHRPNLHISGLDIRPWYGETVFGIPRREPGVSGGPNIQPTDHYPPIEDDPFFKGWAEPVPQDWYFTYRQLLMLDRQTVPVDAVVKPDLFADPLDVLVQVQHVEQPPEFLDLYSGDYTEIYGVENADAEGTYVDDYDAGNNY